MPWGCSQQAGLHDNVVLPGPTGSEVARGVARFGRQPEVEVTGSRAAAMGAERREEEVELGGGGSMVEWQKMRKRDAIPC